MTDKNAIIHFAQDMLGCGCPPEVFENIKVDENYQLCPYTRLSHRIVIGSKLLIYIIEIKDNKYIDDNFMAAIFTGKNERDSSGLNRLRIVLLHDNPVEIESAATEIFSSMAKFDDKIHLHIFKKTDMPQI